MKYDLKEGSGSGGVDYSDSIVASGDHVTVKKAPVREGYRFIGWRIKETGQTVEVGETIKITENLTFEALWAKADTDYWKLRLRIPIATRTKNKLVWTRVTEADGYVVFGNRCNTRKQTYTIVKRAVIKGGNKLTWTDKKLKSGTYYKYYVKAYKLVNGKKVWIAKSNIAHSTTTGGRYGNARTVKVNKKKVSLKKGKTFAIKAREVKWNKPIQKHANIKYESSNTKVAKVSRKGKVTAVGKGTCYIYVSAQNGMYKKIKVTVK